MSVLDCECAKLRGTWQRARVRRPWSRSGVKFDLERCRKGPIGILTFRELQLGPCAAASRKQRYKTQEKVVRAQVCRLKIRHFGIRPVIASCFLQRVAIGEAFEVAKLHLRSPRNQARALHLHITKFKMASKAQLDKQQRMTHERYSHGFVLTVCRAANHIPKLQDDAAKHRLQDRRHRARDRRTQVRLTSLTKSPK